MSDNDDFITVLIAAGIIAIAGTGLYLFLKDWGSYEEGDEVNGDELVESEEKEDDRRLCVNCNKQITYNVCKSKYCNNPVCKKCAERDFGLCYFCFNG